MFEEGSKSIVDHSETPAKEAHARVPESSLEHRPLRDGETRRHFMTIAASHRIPPMPHLRSVCLRDVLPEGPQPFPFSVPVIRHLEPLEISRSMTLLVGENGSGKSTLLEGIAAAANLPAIGSDGVATEKTLAAQSQLGRALRLTWNRRAKRGFFLRAEDFFGFTNALSKMRVEFLGEMARIDVEYEGRSE